VRAAVAAVLGTTAIAGFVAPVHAQESGEALEEVKVTGSRILRRDLDATSPLVTVGSEAFESSGTVALETSLNKLPQFVPAVTQFVTTDVQNTAVNTVGASTINLRGLGTNRNLVLLDGRRAMPVNASLAVDINSIPSAAIKRVEVITGGASSAYGADAVGGVVNFILKNDFEGMEFDTQYGMTEFGDDQELRVSGLMGGNFSDNRGNAMFGVEYFKRTSAKTSERDFFTKGWADPSVGGTEFFFSDSYFTSDFFNLPNQNTIDGLFGQAAPGAVSNNGAFFLNTDGTLFTGGSNFGAGDVDGAYRYNGVLDGRFRSKTTAGLIKENQQSVLVSIPEDRYSLFGRADYDILDKLSFFIQGNFTKTHTQSVLQFSPAVNGWAANIPTGTGIYAPSLAADGVTTRAEYLAGGRYGLNCPATGGCTNSQAFPVSPELAAVLASRGNPNAPWTLNRVLDFIGPRSSINDAQTYQVLAGLNGVLPFGDWTWEAYVSHGNTEVTNGLLGFGSVSRWRAIVTSPNYGKGASVTGNQGAPGNGFAAATGTCTTGVPIFGDFPVSQDCIDAITGNMQNVTNMDQDIAEVNLQGGLFNLPAGEVRGAVGGDWRKNTFSYQVDILGGTSSFQDGPIGLFPAASTKGSTEVKEGYLELLVPVLADIPAIQRLNLELGYRFSDYDTAGSVNTYKALADWTIVDSVRFRGGFQRANRAPNIGELFLPSTQVVAGTAFGDPCAANTTARWGTNPALNANAAQALALCQTLMGAAGAAQFYAQAPTGAPATIVTVNNVGNPNLGNETADTLTAGFVFRPQFEAKLLSRLTASLDWYSIKIDNTISPVTFDTIYNQCLNVQFNPTFDPNNAFCKLIQRDPTNGGIGQTQAQTRNVGKLETSGVDLNIDWAADLADMGMASLPGSLALNLAVTYLDKFESQDIAGAPVVDFAGTVGGLTGSTGQYRYKTFTTVTYSTGGIAASLRWRHLPSAHAAAFAQNPLTINQGPDHYDVVDLTGNWELSQSYQVRFGVENLFDRDPEITNYIPSGPTATTGQGTTNPGYYDVLGRRYYLGFKARF
jgi:outer membrane receptor protein involved in Fe transport